jgi:hypothetical protein
MVDLERLAVQARRQAERGRLLAAARVLGVVVPLGLVAAAAGVSLPPCLGATALLALLTVWLRWWHGDGWAGTSLGLRLGAVPYTLGLATTCLGQSASPGWAVACGLACGVASLGVVLSSRAVTARRGWRVAAAGLMVASAASALGCFELLLAAT